MANTRDRAYGIILALALVLVFALYATTINPEISDLSGDSARFLLLAKSLAQGSGYREIEKPEAPPHAEYMPGLPAILAAIRHFAPRDLRPMKLLMVVSAFAAALCFWRLLFREPRTARLLMTLAFAWVPFLFSFQTQILSDLPHLALLLFGFCCFERNREKHEASSVKWILTGVIFAAAFYFRQLALLAFASGLMVMLMLRDLRRLKAVLGYFLGFALPVSGWYLRNRLVVGAFEPSYGQKLWSAKASNPFAGTLDWAGLIARIGRRIWFFNVHLEKDMLLGSEWRGLVVIWTILIAFMLIGLGFELFKKKNSAAVFYLPYLLVISGWEFWVPRYLLPLLPLSILFVFRGLGIFAGALSKMRLPCSRHLASAAIFLWMAGNLARALTVVSFQHTPLPYPVPELAGREKDAAAVIGEIDFASYPDAAKWKQKGFENLVLKSAQYYHFFAMAEWAGKNLGPEDVVVCRKPTLFAWRSRGKSVQFPPELEIDRFLAEVDKRGGRLILVEEISPELRPILFQFWRSRPERFKLEKQLGQTYLLRIMG